MLGLQRIHRTIRTIRTIPPVRLRTFCNKSHRNDNVSVSDIAIISVLYGGGMGGATYGLCNGYMMSRKDNFLNCVSMTTTCGILGFLSGTGMDVSSMEYVVLTKPHKIKKQYSCILTS